MLSRTTMLALAVQVLAQSSSNAQAEREQLREEARGGDWWELREDIARRLSKPMARPRRPRPPVEVLPPIPAPRGKVYPGGSVPGGARRAAEREMRAQDACFFCEGSGWQCSGHPTRGVPVFTRCEGCGNPRELPSP